MFGIKRNQCVTINKNYLKEEVIMHLLLLLHQHDSHLRLPSLIYELLSLSQNVLMLLIQVVIVQLTNISKSANSLASYANEQVIQQSEQVPEKFSNGDSGTASAPQIVHQRDRRMTWLRVLVQSGGQPLLTVSTGALRPKLDVLCVIY